MCTCHVFFILNTEYWSYRPYPYSKLALSLKVIFFHRLLHCTASHICWRWTEDKNGIVQRREDQPEQLWTKAGVCIFIIIIMFFICLKDTGYISDIVFLGKNKLQDIAQTISTLLLLHMYVSFAALLMLVWLLTVDRYWHAAWLILSQNMILSPIPKTSLLWSSWCRGKFVKCEPFSMLLKLAYCDRGKVVDESVILMYK